MLGAAPAPSLDCRGSAGLDELLFRRRGSDGAANGADDTLV